ncbi:biotin/lipoate A/B protein ligase family protein [Pullulanibacillus sp. KACC 23026]|uniref:lipoate--protein ligase family protein n=1 Tax=Pullulanibacillus sp. KACC 23026 TaxID=3028315 RepID=UPI0023AFEBB0|nr:biotin/lipoate A/B protein ligase family protein [Pullulanibacillus sp. KACC 23026]WEG13739.1 biotin/lipoate A/B protein ligase family protein [Pullulanibacillus sp. KACC 23026]
MKEKWAFLDTGVLTPSMNMAVDEALLIWHSQGLLPPVLRFYEWQPAGLSVGYFQRVKGKIDVDAAKRHGFEIVRRQTGGRAVLHDRELTYSVIVSEQHEKMPSSVTDAYRVISEGLLKGFQNLGMEAGFAIPEGKLGQTGSAVCFEEPSWYELVVNGKKAAGSAQTRQKGVILQHGSIPLEVDENTLFDLFIYPNERVKERARNSFGDKAIAINDVLDVKVTVDDVRAAFKKGFEDGLQIEFETLSLDDVQWAYIEELAKTKYEDESYTYSR